MGPQLRFVTAAELEVEQHGWGTNQWLCRTSICEAKQLALCRVLVVPGQGHDFHRHPEQEEIIYVVAGQAEQWVGQERRLLGAGEMAHIPRDLVHATFNPTDERLVILAILSPAESQGPFLIEMHEQEPWRSLRSSPHPTEPKR